LRGKGGVFLLALDRDGCIRNHGARIVEHSSVNGTLEFLHFLKRRQPQPIAAG
jgi:hypothetical protein